MDLFALSSKVCGLRAPNAEDANNAIWMIEEDTPVGPECSQVTATLSALNPDMPASIRPTHPIFHILQSPPLKFLQAQVEG
ncbi:hypothetical protein AB1N83_003340 [Pleurotus pulmonarius]